MLDSTRAGDIPFFYEGMEMRLVAGYVNDPRVKNGRWADEDWGRFPPHVRRVRICIYADRLDAQVIDVEPGNCTAKQAVQWIKAKWERGETPTAYCFSDAGPAGYRISDVRRECDAAGVKRPLIWITRFSREWDDLDPSGDPEIIALQYDNSAETMGHFDASVVADYWPGVDVDPEKGEDMEPSQEYKDRLQKQLETTVYAPLNDLLLRLEKLEKGRAGHKHNFKGETE